MSPPTQSRKITIAGVGNVGSSILNALLAKGIHQVSVITRAESTSTFPAGVHAVHRGSYDDEAFLVKVLEGQDVLIGSLGFMAIDIQERLIRAAAKAHVPYYVPNEFSSDQTNAQLREASPLLKPKDKYRQLVEELGVSSWVGIICNPWLDYLMRIKFWPIDFENRKVVLSDGGEDKAIFSTLPDVGKGVAAVLSLPEAELAAYKNGWVHLSSFRITQREVFESALRATGTKEADWTVETEDSAAALKVAGEAAMKGDMLAGVKMLIVTTFKPGFGGDYQEKVVDYGRLGVETEKLDDVVKRIVDETKA